MKVALVGTGANGASIGATDIEQLDIVVETPLDTLLDGFVLAHSTTTIPSGLEKVTLQ